MKFILMMESGEFVQENGEPTSFASLAVLFSNKSVAQIAAYGITGARVVPLVGVKPYQHEDRSGVVTFFRSNGA